MRTNAKSFIRCASHGGSDVIESDLGGWRRLIRRSAMDVSIFAVGAQRRFCHCGRGTYRSR